MAWRRERASGKGAGACWRLGARYRLPRLVVGTPEQARALDGARLDVAWPGHRLVACRVGEDVRLFADDQREWTEPLSAIAIDLGQLPVEAVVIEGVACVLVDGRPDFEALRRWVAGTRQGTLAFLATDLWHLDGIDLAGRALPERLLQLERLVANRSTVRPSMALDGPIDRVLTSVAELGLPGVVARAAAKALVVPSGAGTLELGRSLAPAPVITHPEKVLFPRDGLTKRALVAYYRDVAPALLPHMRQRPIVAQRWPDGIDEFTWYQHRVPPRAPDYLKVALIDGNRRLLIEDADALGWMVNQAALTFHGWATRVGALDSPDYAIIDLDPGPATSWAQVIEVALAIRALLELLEAPSVVKTSGQHGLHVLVPLAPGQTLEQAHDFASGLCTMVAQLKPELASLEADKVRRRGRLFLDVLQNFRGKSLVLPYSLRAVDGAPVSTPLTWAEVADSTSARAFTLRDVRRRLDGQGDLAAPLLEGRFLLGPALDRLRGR
jgi:DNA ligase D-like protein (predicted polymerase)